MKLVVFLGYKNSGKTTAIERTVRTLARAGFKVGTIKHLHGARFSLDTPHKDTWRHARAGASAVVAVASSELVTMLKGDTRRMTAEEIARPLAREGFDYVLVEGLYRRIGSRRGVTYVLCAGNIGEAEDLLRKHPRVSCITGRVAGGRSGKSFRGIPFVRLPRDREKLLEILRTKRAPPGSSS